MGADDEATLIGKRRRALHQAVGNASQRFDPSNPADEDITGAKGEIQFAREYRYAVDKMDRPYGDGGIDFHTALGIINVKTYKKPLNLPVKVSEKWHNVVIYVLAHDQGDQCSLLGWAYKKDILTYLIKELRKFPDGTGLPSHVMPREALNTMGELSDRLRDAAYW